MEYDEALAYCYLQGMFLADPSENSTFYWTSLLYALDQNETYWFDHGSCRTIDRDAAIQTESCKKNNKVVCQTNRVQNECIKTESSCEECFIGKTPEQSGGRPSLKDIDIEKSFKIRFDLDCNDVSINENGGTVVDITLKEETRKTGSFKYGASSIDEILVNSSSNVTSRIYSNDRTFTQLYTRPNWIFTHL